MHFEQSPQLDCLSVYGTHTEQDAERNEARLGSEDFVSNLRKPGTGDVDTQSFHFNTVPCEDACTIRMYGAEIFTSLKVRLLCLTNIQVR